jgi:hypothetical protein
MKYAVIGASAAALALTTLVPSALANRSQDIYWSCWKQADYVRPALDPRGKEGWVANCVANATPYYNARRRHRANPNY